MRLSRVCALTVCLTFPLMSLRARADPERGSTVTVNFLSASEFGGGIGAGIEIGDRNTFVAGIGTGWAFGHTDGIGWHGLLAPGAAIGFRHYLGNWYLGPTASVNQSFPLGQDLTKSTPQLGLIGLMDVGYRWLWSGGSRWNTKLGLAGGVGWQTEDGFAPAVVLHVSVGFSL